jgi:hypothetical protein
MRPIPEDLDYKVDEKYWGEPLDLNDGRHLEPEVLNGYITCMLLSYQGKFREGLDLWEEFHDDFEGFTVEIFTRANRKALKPLREHLVMHGVWVDRARGTLSWAKCLHDCLRETEPAEWTQERIKERAPLLEQQKRIARNTTNALQPQSSQLPGSHPAQQPPRQPTPIQPEEELAQQLVRAPGPTISKLLTELTKLYSDQEKKFGGELYDILAIKLRIFYDSCRKVGIDAGQFHYAYSIMLKGRASAFYYDRLAASNLNFTQMIHETRCHFETEENKQFYLAEWRETTFPRIIAANPGVSRLECLQKLFDKLQTIQRGLSGSYQEDLSLRDQVISACRGVGECNYALYNPASTYEGVCWQLRSAVGTAVRSQEMSQFTNHPSDHHDRDLHDHNWTDRTYGGRGRSRGFDQRRSRGREGPRSFRNDRDRPKKCYVCGKPGCWSTRHSMDERKDAYDRFRQTVRNVGSRNDSSAHFQTFLAEYEGAEELASEPMDEASQMIMDMELEEGYDVIDTGQFFTEFGEIDGIRTIECLNDQSVFHSVTKTDVFSEPIDTSTFSFDERYSSGVFHGIIPDTGAAGVSTAGEPQVRALQQIDKSIEIDESTAGQHHIRFGKGTATSTGTITVPTPIGQITFHVVPADTPFLLCLGDMDKLGVKFDNIDNLLIQGQNRVPVVRKWGHPWLLIHQREQSIAWCHLTEPELRQLHRRFGHPSVRRLFNVLQRAGHDVELKMIEHLTKFCHYCQMNQRSPGRFRFTLKEDHEFNFSVIIDVLYLNGKAVLQVVDSSTAFQAARFLKDMSARNAWDTLRLCWIDVYLGPPDQIVHDAGKNFSSAEFRQQAKAMAIDVKEVPVEAHNSVGKVERYHAPLRRAYEIISEELEGASDEIILQMAVKAVNDSAGPDGLVPTLLVFGAYPRMTDESPPSPTIVQRAEAIRKASKEVRRLYAIRQINDALGMRNGPNTSETTSLPIQSDVRVWREKGGWSGPHKLLATDGQTCTLQMPYGPAQFRATVVKPYYTEIPTAIRQTDQEQDQRSADDRSDGESENEEPQPVIRRGRGRPPGALNRVVPQAPTRRSGRERRVRDLDLEDDFDRQFVSAVLESKQLSMVFMTHKEQADYELSLKLRKEGRITTPGAPFEASNMQEIEGLMARGVFQFERYDPDKFDGVRIFKSRMVNEIKGKATDAPFEKSRLVIQGYNDDGKEIILTQSPTIQRASQRLIIALAPTLMKRGMSVYLRDITQAYTQSETQLRRLILAQLPVQIRDQYPSDTVMIILKPLYGIAEAGTHWWATYIRHHKENLSMITSTYDPCCLITSTGTPFGIVGMQTDDTLILADTQFAALEETELTKAKLMAKPKEKLDSDTPLLFNGCIISVTDDTIALRPKGQGKKIHVIDDKVSEKQAYVEQRARGAYIASICQPEASFDLSVAAQHQDPSNDDVKALNKRLIWQINHLDRGLSYVPLDLATAKLFVFVDGSFANNKDLSSQLGFLIILANESANENEFNEFAIRGNLIHWSSTKSKRVTRSVLASEIYGMVSGVDMAIALGTTIKLITDRLELPAIPIIACTDSYSLYECLVKLGTTKEKRLMIDIMALRQSYERRELFEIRWINGADNPADAMTKANPNKSLESFVDTNSLSVRVEGWVERE